ncbi:hypothetical protein QVH35_04315 [Candidatus Nitrosotenuis chungbukensis]|uniref:hypothetical protein n=1 Tax=Candidatus Nitrosotenuis chungbukensis TaxID=1353246 RepID=UPI00267397CF|nr:hypothetical protein [Candidatus Nitrosotenuis chungbukensis]WKT58608.1 hypothetical protein QVH35_04315 [Candidatus Nitrosotenuis chungbukensis]
MNSKRTLAAVFATLLLSQMSSIAQFNAYGDGLTQENLPPASFGDRQACTFHQN